ncbi:hypothetical protein [Nostoc sp. MS1]|uniref:hypothetical protein n=1 Tax=Nostoc sp. MS1 TaxID=2764711 RepID=UPI001CC7BA29|nr:hypothetical protein [Nostoc sp. MS1]
MDEKAHLTTVELNPDNAAIAQRYLGNDPRVDKCIDVVQRIMERSKAPKPCL